MLRLFLVGLSLVKGHAFRRAERSKNCHPERRPNERSGRGQAKDLL